jgi:hypothetical protein
MRKARRAKQHHNVSLASDELASTNERKTMNIEEQKTQIARLFEGVRINGVEADIRFSEGSEDRRIDAIVENTEERMRPLPISFAIREENPEEAVIADILSQFVTPDELPHSVSSTVLEITEKTDSLICAFAEYSDHEIASASYYDSPQLRKVKLSTRAMDRLACAWIKWRTKNYEPSNSGITEIEDHPF